MVLTSDRNLEIFSRCVSNRCDDTHYLNKMRRDAKFCFSSKMRMTRSRVAILEIESESDDGGIGALAPCGVSQSVSFKRHPARRKKKVSPKVAEKVSHRKYSLRNRSMENEEKADEADDDEEAEHVMRKSKKRRVPVSSEQRSKSWFALFEFTNHSRNSCITLHIILL